MSRHRGTYKPLKCEPYELSRGKIETLLNCPACFWLDRAKGVKFPGIPGFLLNTNTDTLLKRDFDRWRGKQASPLMIKAGLEHLRPFQHEDIGKWESSLQFGSSPNHFNTLHEETNILFGGGLDDVWENIETGELHIVDYKSTAQMSNTPKPLDESFIAPPTDPKQPDYKASYRRQMEMYQWIARRKGFTVSDIGYFVYVDGQHVGIDGMLDEENTDTAWMKFNVAVIPYAGNDDWVEDAIKLAKETVVLEDCPPHSESCEFSRFLDQAISAEKRLEEAPNTPIKQDPLASGRKRKAMREQAEKESAKEAFKDFSDWRDGND